MPINVVIFGATGMVGEGVLHESLLDGNVDSVLVVGRRPCSVSHPKLKEILHSDFHNYSSIEKDLRGYDACFFCLGVTSIGKNEHDYRRLTYDLTMAAAKTLVRLNPNMVFCYVSGSGTDSTEQGKLMWARVKGKTENDLMKLPFKAAYAFRPGFINPIPGLKNSFKISTMIAPLYPFLKTVAAKYVCTLEDVGRSMLYVALNSSTKKVLECEDITRLGREHVAK
jgi:uncharacterized protein YbjT (DUF2867 family)